MNKENPFIFLFLALILLNGCQLLPQSAGGRDDDGDGISNLFDVDDDGDGLIEIDNAMQLSNMRLVPDGSGYKSSPFGGTSKRGCDAGCRGYELRADIDLSSINDWLSIGNNFFYEEQLQIGRPFTAILDGNGRGIHNLKIRGHIFKSQHQGLFASTEGATIRNLHIYNADIRAGKAAGALIGFAEHTDITAVSVSASSIIGKEAGGGLVGYGDNVHIRSSYARDSRIRSSDNSGGLIGNGNRTSIRASYALKNSIEGNSRVGGLAGNGNSLVIATSYSAQQEMKGRIDVGGLIGFASSGAVYFSYSANRGLGNYRSGGLIGKWRKKPELLFSYWDKDTGRAIDNGYGTPQTSADLTAPADFSGIYAEWLNGEPELIWCDRDGSGWVEENEQTDENRIWSMGGDGEYPSIGCIEPPH